MTTKQNASDEPLDDAHYDRLSQLVESDDFELATDAAVRPGTGEAPGREFLSQYLTDDELTAATRRGRGRPSLSGHGRSQPRQVRLPADLDALLIQRAAAENRPLSQVLRDAVANYLRPPAA